MATLYAVIKTPEKTGLVYRHRGATAPLIVSVDSIEADTVLGYWEGRLDIHMWACEQMEVNPEEATFVDGFTGSEFGYWQLMYEEDELDKAI